MPKIFLADSLSGFSITCVNCQHYEISNCEPLHDITNVVQNLLTELSHHMPSPSLQKEYQTFCELLIGDKNQIKGNKHLCLWNPIHQLGRFSSD
jgi:hypothetical protein